MMIVVASCAPCKLNFICQHQTLNPPENERCYACGAEAVQRVRIDLDSGAVEAGYQDRTGQPIRPGDLVRYKGKLALIEKIGLPRLSCGARGVKLVGEEEPASEWSIDRVAQKIRDGEGQCSQEEQ